MTGQRCRPRVAPLAGATRGLVVFRGIVAPGRLKTVLVSHAKRFIYLKTFKAASTSVEVHFQPSCMPSLSDPVEHHCPESISPSGIVGARGPHDRDNTTYYNHMTASEIRERIGRRTFRRYLKFAVTRDPYERMVSAFWFAASPGERRNLASAPMSEVSEKFSEFVRETPARWISEPILTIEGQCVLDRVIRFEHLNEDVESLARDLGVTADHPLPRLKTDTRQRSEPAAAYYDAASRAAVGEAHAWEFAEFGYPR